MKSILINLTFLFTVFSATAQTGSIKGLVKSNNTAVDNITIKISGSNRSVKTDAFGNYQMGNIPYGRYEMIFSGVGYKSQRKKIEVKEAVQVVDVLLEEVESSLNEVVVTGVNRATELRKSPVPIAVLSKKSMDQNVNTNLIEAIVKGVPGVTAVTTGPNVSKPFIRGLGYNRVLTLYDGLRQEGQQWGDEHGIEVDEYGISRAEVVKGPASLNVWI